MADGGGIRFVNGPHTRPIPPQTAVNRIGKVRRPPGEPVATEKEPLRFQVVPAAAPANLNLPLDVVAPDAAHEATSSGKLVFHCVGDTGGIHGDSAQVAVAEAMEAQYQDADNKPAFLYHLGDVIYFNGLSADYKWQFYEPYQYYPGLVFAIPGNHDGDTSVRAGDQPDTEPSLYGFMQNFCDTAPRAVPYRHTMTQPYVYWTLDTPLVTIVGLYSNVEGSLDARGRNDQQSWLSSQLAAAPAGKKLIVAAHHPCYSLDSAHGGSPDVLIALDRAMVSAGRVPDAVLSGHVHNYQRFSRSIDGRAVPYIVAGAGGYATTPQQMHRLQKGLESQVPQGTTHPDITLENFNQSDPGFLRIIVTKAEITIEYHLVPFDQSPSTLFDSVTVS